jgi:hypothetical protein
MLTDPSWMGGCKVLIEGRKTVMALQFKEMPESDDIEDV